MGLSCIDPFEVGLGLKGATRLIPVQGGASRAIRESERALSAFRKGQSHYCEMCLVEKFLGIDHLCRTVNDAITVLSKFQVISRGDRWRQKGLVERKNRHNYFCLKCAGSRASGPVNCAGCATGRRTFKLMTFNAKLHCTRRGSGLERGLTGKMYPSGNKKERKKE